MPKIPITARRMVTAMAACRPPGGERSFAFVFSTEKRVIQRLVGYLGGLTPSRSERETPPSYRLRTPM